MANIFHLEADYKVDKKVREPIVTQNDTVVFYIALLDNGVPVDLSEITAVTMAHERPDGVTVVTLGSVYDENIIELPLGGTEFESLGVVNGTAQMYMGSERVSTLRFPYRVVKDPTGQGFIPSESDRTLIQIVLEDGRQVIADAQAAIGTIEAAVTEAGDAATAANDAAQAATTATGLTNQAITGANGARDEALDAAGAANTAASEANEARDDARTAIADTVVAIGNAETATERANDAAANIEGWTTAEPWNNTKAYVTNNVVTYNGSTYQATADNTNTQPGTSSNWILLASKGLDGSGAVSTVNGISPDGNGNVTVPTAELVNNLFSDDVTKALAAPQGKVIYDSVMSHYNNQGRNKHINPVSTLPATLSDSGVYMVLGGTGNTVPDPDDFETHKDTLATLTQVGHTQLSSAIDSDAENRSATPKAVKAAYDRAELAFTQANDIKARWADTIGEPLESTDTSAQLQGKTQAIMIDMIGRLRNLEVPVPYTAKLQEISDFILQIGPSGSRIASGRITSSSVTMPFTSATGVAANYYTLSIMGLPFTPRTIICRPVTANVAGSITAVQLDFDKVNGFDVINVDTAAIRLAGNAVITNGGFYLPANRSNVVYQWAAYE